MSAPAVPARRPSRGKFAAIFHVNLQLLGATACGFTAWAIWPSTPEWWGLGLLSIILSFAALAGIANAAKAMAGLYHRERVIADYMAQGGAPKSARLVTTEQLRQAGMVD
jgi:hypothetical protein